MLGIFRKPAENEQMVLYRSVMCPHLVPGVTKELDAYVLFCGVISLRTTSMTKDLEQKLR